MKKLQLVRPQITHKAQYEEMMDEWEQYGGRINPGALRRYSHVQQKNVDFERWLEWIESDRLTMQDLFFLVKGERILGAISVRYKSFGIDGHSGFGIRPSERNKGYASKMLEMALPMLRELGHNPIILSCEKDNLGSAKTILKNGGKFVKEVVDDAGKLVLVYHIE